MTCPTCADRGLVKVNWKDAQEDYAVCLCPTGELLRADSTPGQLPAWRVLAHRMDIDPARVVMLEDVCTPEELAERGFRELTADTAMDAIVAAARGRKVGR
jgi:hypothetical protein